MFIQTLCSPTLRLFRGRRIVGLPGMLQGGTGQSEHFIGFHFPACVAAQETLDVDFSGNSF